MFKKIDAVFVLLLIIGLMISAVSDNAAFDATVLLSPFVYVLGRVLFFLEFS